MQHYQHPRVAERSDYSDLDNGLVKKNRKIEKYEKKSARRKEQTTRSLAFLVGRTTCQLEKVTVPSAESGQTLEPLH